MIPDTQAPIKALSRTLETMPEGPLLLHARGDLHARSTRWKEAAIDLSRAVELGPDNTWAWFCCAAVLARMEDATAYRRHCRRMLERFGATKYPGIADRIAKACLFAPGAVDDLGPVVELTRRSLAASPDGPWYQYFELTRGMVDYRAGRFSSAVSWLRRSQAAKQPMNHKGRAMATLFQAMAHQRLGEKALAREAFDRAQKLAGKDYAELRSGSVEPDWPDVVVGELVDREARALLGM